MKTAKELYLSENCEKGHYFEAPDDYQPIIDSIGTVLIQVDDNDHSGDSRVLYEKDGKYGLLVFGWGSCSGCDALQGCESFEEIDALIEDIENEVKWFDSLSELKSYVSKKDWELDSCWHANPNATKEFILKILEYSLQP